MKLYSIKIISTFKIFNLIWPHYQYTKKTNRQEHQNTVKITKFCTKNELSPGCMPFLGNILVISGIEISNFYATWRFIITFTKAWQWKAFWANPIQTTLIQLISLKYISILSSICSTFLTSPFMLHLLLYLSP